MLGCSSVAAGVGLGSIELVKSVESAEDRVQGLVSCKKVDPKQTHKAYAIIKIKDNKNKKTNSVA
jgi:hypothetical protein